jgi:hypothetical protein
MMRVDLPTSLMPGGTLEFEVRYSFPILNSRIQRSRSCYELLPETNYPIYEIAQWFPRMAAYTDVNGWQHKQFLGKRRVHARVRRLRGRAHRARRSRRRARPGELQNATEVLSAAQRERLGRRRPRRTRCFIVTPEEALANEKERPAVARRPGVQREERARLRLGSKPRKFIWDAMGAPVHDLHGKIPTPRWR